MNTAIDYIDRRFDLLALQGVSLQGEAQLEQALFGENSGAVCTGMQKLAQRWLLEFCTIRGSIRFLPNRGTDFLLLARRGAFRNEQDVIAEYNFAAVRTKQTLLNEEVAAMEADERLETDRLLGLQLSPGFLMLRTQLVSQAGNTRQIILPIPVSPIKTGL